jgi:hypothetical protein
VPIIAVCPYCQTGRVRAPNHAIGMLATCPRCQSSFTVVDSGETEEVARQRVSGQPSVPRPAPEPVPQSQVATAPLETTAVITVPRPLPVVADDDEEAAADPARVATVIAFLLAGAALIAAQFPYGRFGTVGAAVVGGLLAAAAAFGARRPVYPIVATSLNGLILLIAFLLPGWLGLDSWRPAPATKDTRIVQVLNAEGLQNPKSEWIEVGQAWQFDDVRVVATPSLGPVEMLGPKGQPAWSKKNYIRIRVRVGNVGVARAIKFDGWDPNAVKLKDASGTAVPPAKFDNGWLLTETSKPATLTPGKSADWLLFFEAPANPTEYYRIELPGAPCGVPDSPIRFQIPARSLSGRLNQEARP